MIPVESKQDASASATVTNGREKNVARTRNMKSGEKENERMGRKKKKHEKQNCENGNFATVGVFCSNFDTMERNQHTDAFAVGHLHFLLFVLGRPCGIDHKSVDCFPNEHRQFFVVTPPDYRRCRSIDFVIDQVPAKKKNNYMSRRNR